MKIQLPNGCTSSNLSVNPKNWQTKNPSTSKDWFISYRFYNPKSEKPKQIILKGNVNRFKSVTERQNEIKRLISEELVKLQNGFNPTNKNAEFSFLTDKNKSEDLLTVIDALNLASKKVTVAIRTQKDITYTLSKIGRAITVLGWQNMLIAEISRKHIKAILDNASGSNDSFNKNRSYLMILMSSLCEIEIVPINHVRDIKKKKIIKKIRPVLSDEERKFINVFLETNHPAFHRFLQIFFHSGARISELMRVKESDVELNNQRFKVIVLKGSQYKEVWKTIKDIALPYWNSLMQNYTKGDYIFSKGLKPGLQQIKSYQIDKRWYRLIKKKFEINADFYSIKHLHTTEVVDLLNDMEAAKHNDHTSTKMVNEVYDVKRNSRSSNQIKGLTNSFA